MGFIQKAIDSASLLIQTQFESEDFRGGLRYTIVRTKPKSPDPRSAALFILLIFSQDYNGTPTYQASGFIMKALGAEYARLDCRKPIAALLQAAQMFEQAGAAEVAAEIRREQERLALLSQTVIFSRGLRKR